MPKYNNILVHSLVNIGDVLLSTSAAALLKQICPEAKITMMVRSAAAELVTNNPVIDEVIIYDYKAKHRSFGSMNKMVQLLKNKKFDLSISFDRKLRPALLTWLAGIPVRVGPERVFNDEPSKVTWLYTHVVKIPHNIVNTLQADTYQAIVRGFFKAQGSEKPVMAQITKENEANAEALLQLLPNGKQDNPLRIALCVKGTFALKDWHPARFAEVVDNLAAQYNAVFFIIGAPNDKAYADTVIQQAKVPIENFCGKTNLVDLAALLAKANLFITVDTGAAHIAATVGVPIVILYGCTSPNRWKPIAEKVKTLVKNPGCSPCAKNPEECQEHTCMERIMVAEVFTAVSELLDNEQSVSLLSAI